MMDENQKNHPLGTPLDPPDALFFFDYLSASYILPDWTSSNFNPSIWTGKPNYELRTTNDSIGILITNSTSLNTTFYTPSH